MAWVYLLIAGLLEVVWAVLMKQASQPGRGWFFWPMAAAMVGSFYFLWLALRGTPVGTAYAVWTGIGAVGVAAVGILFLHEPRSALRLASIALIVIGIVGLKMAK